MREVGAVEHEELAGSDSMLEDGEHVAGSGRRRGEEALAAEVGGGFSDALTRAPILGIDGGEVESHLCEKWLRAEVEHGEGFDGDGVQDPGESDRAALPIEEALQLVLTGLLRRCEVDGRRTIRSVPATAEKPGTLAGERVAVRGGVAVGRSRPRPCPEGLDRREQRLLGGSYATIPSASASINACTAGKSFAWRRSAGL